MTPALFLVNELPTGETFTLTGDEGRHAAKVRRIGVGESLTVSDGNGGLADCTVLAVVADGLQLQWMQDPSIDMAATVSALFDALDPRPKTGEQP